MKTNGEQNVEDVFPPGEYAKISDSETDGVLETAKDRSSAEIPGAAMAEIHYISEKARQRIKAEKLQIERKINTISSSDLATKVFSPIEWAVKDLLPEGYGILGGRPKIGKSWLVYEVALAVGSGGCILGNKDFLVKPGVSLYLALEDNHRRLQERQRILLGGQAQGVANLHLATDWRRLDDGGLDDLEHWLTAYPDCRLVIIDTLARVKPRLKRGADAYEHEMEIGGKLQALAHKHHICLLAIHHTRKSKSETGDFIDELAGSTGITGAPDFVAQLSRGRQDSAGVLEITGKDIQEIELGIEFKDGLWTYIGSPDAARLNQNQRLIVDLLNGSKNEIFGIADLCGHTGLAEGYVKKIVSNLTSAELIKRLGRGQYASIAYKKQVKE